MASTLKPVRAVRTFTYDPGPFLESLDVGDDVSQEEFENYVAECAAEDFGCGRGSFEILPSNEEEESERMQRSMDALCVWEWYIEESKVHLLSEDGAWENRQFVVEHLTPALNDVWSTFEKLTGDPYPDSYDWEFIPHVLSSWHDKGYEEFMRLVAQRDVRILWMEGFIEEVRAKEKQRKEQFDEGKNQQADQDRNEG